MPKENEISTVRQAVGVFDTVESLEGAIDALCSSGFDRADLSLLAGEQVVREKLGHMYTKVDEIEDDPDTPRTAYVSRESIGAAEGALIGAPLYVVGTLAAGIVTAAGGALFAIILAAAIGGGAGAAAGSLLAKAVGKHHAEYVEQQLRRGGLLLWVRTWTEEQEKQATKILSKYSAHDVHILGFGG